MAADFGAELSDLGAAASRDAGLLEAALAASRSCAPAGVAEYVGVGSVESDRAGAWLLYVPVGAAAGAAVGDGLSRPALRPAWRSVPLLVLGAGATAVRNGTALPG